MFNIHTIEYIRSLGLDPAEILADGWDSETYRWTGEPRTYSEEGELVVEVRTWPFGFSELLLEDALKKDGAWLD